MKIIKEVLKVLGIIIIIIIMISGVMNFSYSLKKDILEKDSMIELQKENLRLEIKLKKKQLNLN